MRASLLFLTTLIVWNTSAQTGGRSLAIKGVFDEGVVKLRWATGSPVVWDLIRTHGIILTRKESRDSLAEVMNSGAPIRVLSDEQWRAKSNDLPAASQVVTLLRDNVKERVQLTDYAQADLEQNKLTAVLLMSEFNLEIAEGLALAWTDKNVQREKIYRYFITVKDYEYNDTLRAECFVNTDEETPFIPVTGIHGESGDGFIDLWWNRQPFHSGYYIERRAFDEKEWKRLNIAPKIYADNYPDKYLYRDSVVNGKAYEYRVRGTDAFGRISESTSSVTVQARDATPPLPPYDIQWRKKNNGVQITWKSPPKESDLAGYALLRSQNPDDNYRPIHQELLKPGTSSFFDVVPKAGTYFYRLISSDTIGNLSSMSTRAMAVIDDTIPAPAPLGLTATADTSGVITIRWRHRMEDDVAGYRLYRMIRGGKNPEFIPLTPRAITDTVFTDTLASSVRDRFVYRVRSVDFAGNYSEPCTQVAVHFPDKLPPVAPMIQDYSVSDGRIRLSFISPSTDVVQYEIHRTSLFTKKRDLSIKTLMRVWTDSTAQHGGEYHYDIIAIDSSGNLSESSKALYVKPFWKKELARPEAPKVLFDANTKSVGITWRYPEERGYSAIIFRRSGSGSLVQLSPKLEQTNFIDTHVKSGEYFYALKFYHTDMGGSAMGRTAAILVP